MKLGLKSIISLILVTITVISVSLIMVLVINRTVNTVQQQMDKYYDAVFIGIEEKIETTFIAWDSILIPKSRNRLLTNSLVDELGRE
ncbi:MAG: hypothetical protein HOE30_00825, partial [Deltaproteobacteria bacterium]|nr:hypothetical protein [Deltaproteobacteria bacterium]